MPTSARGDAFYDPQTIGSKNINAASQAATNSVQGYEYFRSGVDRAAMTLNNPTAWGYPFPSVMSDDSAGPTPANTLVNAVDYAAIIG